MRNSLWPFSLIGISVVLFVGCSSVNQELKKLPEAADSDDMTAPVLALYVYSPTSKPRRHVEPIPSVVFAVWKSGRVIHSIHPRLGGPPYLDEMCNPTFAENILKEISRLGAWEDPTLSRAYFGPDAPYSVLIVKSGEKRLFMRSWHELAEENPNVVATSVGLQSLSGKTRDEVLATQPPNFIRFRTVWSKLRQILDTEVSNNGLKAGSVGFGLDFAGMPYVEK